MFAGDDPALAQETFALKTEPLDNISGRQISRFDIGFEAVQIHFFKSEPDERR